MEDGDHGDAERAEAAAFRRALAALTARARAGGLSGDGWQEGVAALRAGFSAEARNLAKEGMLPEPGAAPAPRDR